MYYRKIILFLIDLICQIAPITSTPIRNEHILQPSYLIFLIYYIDRFDENAIGLWCNLFTVDHQTSPATPNTESFGFN